MLLLGQILETCMHRLQWVGNADGKNVGRECFSSSCCHSSPCCGPICCVSFKAVDLWSWALIYVTRPCVTLLVLLWEGPVSKVPGFPGLLLEAHFCAYKSCFSLQTLGGEDGSLLLWFPHCRSPTKLPLMMVTMSEVLEEMVPVLLSVAVLWLLAGVLHWTRGTGLSRLVSILLTTSSVCCCDATMLTTHPRHTVRPTAGRLCSRGLCSLESLSPVTNCEGPHRWWLPVRSC